MLLDQRTSSFPQIQAEPNLDQRLSELERIASSDDLESRLLAFLITCQVNECSYFTIRGYRQYIGQFVRFALKLKVRRPAEVTANHIRLFTLHRQQTCNPTTVHNGYRALRRFFNWMVEEGYIEKSPMATMKPPRLPETMVKPFTREQMNQLIECWDDTRFLGARNKAIICMFYDTGLRLQELASIQLKDIDINNRLIKVWGKGSRERVVCFGKATLKALLKLACHHVLL